MDALKLLNVVEYFQTEFQEASNSKKGKETCRREASFIVPDMSMKERGVDSPSWTWIPKEQEMKAFTTL
jgi:hypothetical protein